MADRTPRQRRRARRLDEIRESALELIVEDGFGEFSVHRLADRVDLTAGALYRYFDSRDAIIVAVQIDVLQTFGSYFGAVMSRIEGLGYLEKIAVASRAYCALEELLPERFRLIAHLVSVPEQMIDDEAAIAVMEPTLKLLGDIGALFYEAASAGDLDEGDASDRAILLWSSIQGLMERQKLGRLTPDAFGAEALLTELLRALLVGWGADAEAARRAATHDPGEDLFEEALQEVMP